MQNVLASGVTDAQSPPQGGCLPSGYRAPAGCNPSVQPPLAASDPLGRALVSSSRGNPCSSCVPHHDHPPSQYAMKTSDISKEK